MEDVFTISIKKMNKEDIDAVIELEKSAYGDHHWSKESFLSELSNELARYFCAFDSNGKLVGYCGSWQILEEAHITNIAVAPEFRRKHIGEALLRKRLKSVSATLPQSVCTKNTDLNLSAHEKDIIRTIMKMHLLCGLKIFFTINLNQITTNV